MFAEVVFAAEKIELIENAKVHIFNPIIGLLFGVALIVFLWGLVEFISGQDSEDKVNAGKRHMLWGVIGLAVMVSAFGILNLVVSFLQTL